MDPVADQRLGFAAMMHDEQPSTERFDPMNGLRNRGANQTLTEITQQPELWRQVADAVETWRTGLETAVAAALADGSVRVVLSGAGTSGFVGEVLAPALRRRWHRRVDVVHTTSLLASPQDLLAEDIPTLLVSFARSGNSPESVAIKRLADHGLTRCTHLVITCAAEGRLALENTGRAGSSVLLLPDAANDRGFAMTSSFTGMVLAGWLALTGQAPEPVLGQVANQARASLPTLVESARSLAATCPSRIVYLGSGVFNGLAREAALKVLELTAGRVIGIADSTLGFRHGPKAVLDKSTLVVLFVSSDPYTRRYDLDMLEELRRAQPVGSVVAAGSTDPMPDQGPQWPLPHLTGIDDIWLSLPTVLGAQLLGMQCALAHDIQADNPFPNGDVNRVVKGVTVHPYAEPQP